MRYVYISDTCILKHIRTFPTGIMVSSNVSCHGFNFCPAAQMADYRITLISMYIYITCTMYKTWELEYLTTQCTCDCLLRLNFRNSKP